MKRTFGPAATDTMPAVPAYGVTPLSLKRIRRAVARVRAGVDNAKIICIGDSTTYGPGTVPDVSWPRRLGDMLNAQVAATSMGFGVPQGGFGFAPLADARFTLGTGWTVGSAFGLGSGTGTQCAGAGALTFTPGISCDTIDVYYARWSGGGGLTMSIDGGAASTPATSGAGIAKTTLSCPAGSGHVLTVTRTASTFEWFLGAEAYLSTTKSIHLANGGQGGSKAAEWASLGAGGSMGSLDMLTAYAADLAIIVLGVNDAGVLSATADTVVANLTTIISTIRAAGGDVILASVVPSQPSAQAALEVTYQAAVRALAKSLACPFVDVFGRLVNWTDANGLGFMTDSLHPSAAGYADVASALFGLLRTL